MTRPSAQELDDIRRVVAYDPNDGLLRWKIDGCRVRVGQVADHVNPKGYQRIYLKGRDYASHRVAWLLYYGEWPPSDIDHINRVPSDNRIFNLRLADASSNSANRHGSRSDQLKGITRLPSGKWQSQIQKDKKPHYLGVFNSPQEAHAAYRAKALELFGEFACFESASGHLTSPYEITSSPTGGAP